MLDSKKESKSHSSKIIKTAFIVTTILSIFVFAVIALVLFKGISAVAESRQWNVYIVAGQSNAEGTNSFLSEMPEGQKLGQHPADNDPNNYIMWEGADGAVDIVGGATSDWVKSQNTDGSRLIKINELNNNWSGNVKQSQRSKQFGPEIGMLRELYDKGERNIIILKVSYGFQALAQANSQFQPYDWNPNSSNKSYQKLLDNYQELKSWAQSRGDTFKIKGILWLQGESDSLDSTYSEAYEGNIQLLVERLKSDLSENWHPKAHIVLRKFNFRNCIDNYYPFVGNYCGFGVVGKLEGQVNGYDLKNYSTDSNGNVYRGYVKPSTLEGADWFISRSAQVDNSFIIYYANPSNNSNINYSVAWNSRQSLNYDTSCNNKPAGSNVICGVSANNQQSNQPPTGFDIALESVGECGFLLGRSNSSDPNSCVSDLGLYLRSLINTLYLNPNRVRQVREALQAAANKYDYVDVVETDDLPFYNDFIHLNATGQLEVGKRMINMYDVPIGSD